MKVVGAAMSADHRGGGGTLKEEQDARRRDGERLRGGTKEEGWGRVGGG